MGQAILPIIAVTSTAAGAGMSFMGSMNQASLYESQARLAANQRQVNAAAAEAQARVLERNAMAADAEAALAGLVGDLNQTQSEIESVQIKNRSGAAALQVRREANRVSGGQVVGALRRNIELAGTPALALQETASRAEEDVANILQAGKFDEMNALLQGSLARLGADLQGQRGAMEAETARTSAEQARRSGRVQQFLIPYEQAMGELGAWTSRLQGYGTLLTSMGRMAGQFYRPPGEKS